MRGKVLGYDATSGGGMISGADGSRFAFARDDLQGGSALAIAGQEVDFEVANGGAKSVFILRSGPEKNKYVAALLAFFLGCLGAHRFYLRQPRMGILYLICGTFGWLLVVPAVIVLIASVVETIIYVCKTDEEFYKKYEANNAKPEPKFTANHCLPANGSTRPLRFCPASATKRYPRRPRQAAAKILADVLLPP